MEKKLSKAKEEARKKLNRERMAKYRLRKKNALPTGGGGKVGKKIPVTSKEIDAGVITLTVVRKLVTSRNGFTFGELFGMILATAIIGAALYFIV